MTAVFRFVGNFLCKICENGGGIGWSIFVFTLLVTVFMIFTTIAEIRSLQLADIIRPLHEGICNKFRNKPEQMGKELVGMHKTFGYNTFLGIFSNVIHVIVIILLAGIFFQPNHYLPGLSAEELGFLWIRDLTASPFLLIRQGRFIPELIAAVVSLLLMDFLISWNAQLIIRKSLMPVRTLYKGLTIAAVAVAFFTPQVVLVYLSIYYLLKNIIFILFVRFFPYTLNQSQEAFYKKCVKTIS